MSVYEKSSEPGKLVYNVADEEHYDLDKLLKVLNEQSVFISEAYELFMAMESEVMPPYEALKSLIKQSEEADKCCDWCGKQPINATLDGDDLCLACCNKWAKGEQGTVAQNR